MVFCGIFCDKLLKFAPKNQLIHIKRIKKVKIKYKQDKSTRMANVALLDEDPGVVTSTPPEGVDLGWDDMTVGSLFNGAQWA